MAGPTQQIRSSTQIEGLDLVTGGDDHDHRGGDGAAIVEAAITLADNTTNNASTTKHGFLKKLSNVATQFMNGVGNWVAPKYIDVIGAYGALDTVVAGATVHMQYGLSGTVALAAVIAWPVSGTMKNMSVRTAGAQPATGTLVITFQKNSSNTIIVVTVPAGAAGGTYSDNTHEVAFSATDTIRWTVKNNASTASAPIGGITIQLESDLI